MNKFVVDANVAIKWVIPEIHTELALSLLDNQDNLLFVPDFFFPKIGNILWKRVRRGEMNITQAQLSLDTFKSVDITVFPSEPLIKSALDITYIIGVGE